MTTIKAAMCFNIGIVGAVCAELLGGWTPSMTTLFILMCADYITGIAVAGIFHKSNKSGSGALSSKAGFIGLTRKCAMFLFVVIAYRLDLLLNTNVIKDGTCIGFCVNELISLVENAGLMGVPLPAKLIAAIDVLAKGEKTK